MEFTNEQDYALQQVAKGNSVFITGVAGSGKSLVLLEAIRQLRKQHEGKGVFVTGSNGLAAAAVGGCTVHSFAGIGIGRGTKEELALLVRKNRASRKRWRTCKVLIIEEISQLDGHLFDKLDFVARKNRPAQYANLPFGGIQVICCGDFFQLPSVTSRGENMYAFQSKVWEMLFSLKEHTDRLCLFTQSFRHKDEKLIQILNQVRYNELSDESIKILKATAKTRSADASYTHLYTTNKMVDEANIRYLNSLKSKTIQRYKADDWYANDYLRQHKSVAWNIPSELVLKRGAEVLLLANLDVKRGLVNGTRGKVLRFESDGVLDENDPNSPSTRLYPLVQFHLATGKVVERLITEYELTAEMDQAKFASRSQVPLKLCRAMTIHKSQGMGIDHLVVDLSRCFGYGQAYVALSRAVHLSSLIVLNFSKHCIRVHAVVKQYYNALEEIAAAREFEESVPPSIEFEDEEILAEVDPEPSELSAEALTRAKDAVECRSKPEAGEFEESVPPSIDEHEEISTQAGDTAGSRGSQVDENDYVIPNSLDATDVKLQPTAPIDASQGSECRYESIGNSCNCQSCLENCSVIANKASLEDSDTEAKEPKSPATYKRQDPPVISIYDCGLFKRTKLSQ